MRLRAGRALPWDRGRLARLEPKKPYSTSAAETAAVPGEQDYNARCAEKLLATD